MATDAGQAVAALEYMTPDAILLDLGLPGTSGADLLTKLRARPELENSRYICVSGRYESEVEWRDMGFDAYLQKAATVSAIEAALRAPEVA